MLRVWLRDGFASYICARCSVKGHARAGAEADNPDPAALARARAEAERRDTDEAAARLRIALSLWDRAHPAEGTIVSTYLRSRDIEIDPLPATVRLLRATPPKYPFPAMVAAFGIPEEPEPGVLHMPRGAVMGVHLTLLKADGNGKAGTDRDKIMLGKSAGFPIVLAPPNDGLGLAIAEGVESVLSLYTDFRSGAWAAGSAGRLPGLADRVPSYIGSVQFRAEDDPAGQAGVRELAQLLRARGIEVIEMKGNNDGV